MKKLLSIMIGLSLVIGSGALVFGQEKKDEPKKEDQKKKRKKKGEEEKKP